MTSATVPASPTSYEDLAVTLAWRAWTEIGIAGWGRSHRDWAIDPEPLIVFTAFLDGIDGRLRDEATDWCLRNWRYVSKARLRNLVRAAPADTGASFGALSATVAAHTATTWPDPTEAPPFRASRKSRPPDLNRSSAVWLRLRSIFGLGTRAEILRHFLSRPSREPATASILATTTGYRKRNLNDECDALVNAGVLTVRWHGNARLYVLRRRAPIEDLVGPLPAVRPDWSDVFDLVRLLVEAERSVDGASSPLTVPVRAQAALDTLVPVLGRLDIDIDPPSGPDAIWPTVRNVGEQTLWRWAAGEWDGPRFD